MIRKLTMLLFSSLLILAICSGCISDEVNVKVVEENPTGAIDNALDKTETRENSVRSGPIKIAEQAISNGSFTINVTTPNGSKSNYVCTKNQSERQYYVGCTNKSEGLGWQAILDSEGKFSMQLEPNGSWYVLQLSPDYTGYTNTQLAEVLHWNDHSIWREIDGMYGDLVMNILENSPEDKSGYAAMKEVLQKITQSNEMHSLDEVSIASLTGSHDVVQIAYNIDNAAALDIMDSMFSFFGDADSGYNSLVKNVFRDAITQAGSSAYNFERESDSFLERVNISKYTINQFYDKAERNTMLMLSIDCKSGELVDVTLSAEGKYNSEHSAVSCSWSSNDDCEDKINGAISISLNSANSDDSFTITLDETVSKGTGLYNADVVRCYTTIDTIMKTGSHLSYNEKEASYQINTFVDDRDLALGGEIYEADSVLNMTIDWIGYTCDDPTSVDIDVTVTASSSTIPTVIDSNDLLNLSLEGTAEFYEKFISTMPALIFGEWEANEPIDEKFYQEFDATYDYNKDGAVNEVDKEQYIRIHTILTTTSN